MVALLTLTRNDLAELGVRSEDTGRVLSLITKLKLMSSPGHTPGQCKLSAWLLFPCISALNYSWCCLYKKCIVVIELILMLYLKERAV